MYTLNDEQNRAISDFNLMLQSGRIPCIEYAIIGDDWLVVDITVGNDGVWFNFDQLDLSVYFDGAINGENGYYSIAWSDLEWISLDNILQFIDDNIRDGFIYANNLQPLEED